MRKLLTATVSAYQHLQKWRLLHFPERQIFLRSEGRVRFLTIHSYTQVGIASVLIFTCAWGALTSYAYLSRDFLIEDKNKTITTMSVQYKTLSNDFSALETEVERRAQLLEERQQFLEDFVSTPLVKPDEATPLDDNDLDINAVEKRSFIDSLFGAESDEVDTLTTNERRKNLLDRLNTTQSRQIQLAQHLTQKINDEIRLIDAALAETKLTADLLIEQATPALLGSGGPFIPDRTFDGIFDETDGSAFINLRDSHDRLKMVTNALNSYPVGKPAEDYYLSSRFGRRRDPFKKTWARHPGLDLAGWPGTAIFTTAPGKVVHAGWYGPYGNMVEVDHGNGFRTRYGHMQKIHVKKNDEIELRHQVGDMGKTGRATDTHVHYEVWFDGKVTDPMPFMKAAEYVLEIQGRYEKNSE